MSTIKLGWSVNIKSTQEEEWDNGEVGCDIIWWNPCTVVKDSSFMPLVVVLSLVHQREDLALKSPQIIVNIESPCLWFLFSQNIYLSWLSALSPFKILKYGLCEAH